MKKVFTGLILLILSSSIFAQVDKKGVQNSIDKRAKEYPSVVDQLDDIYHNGIDAWKATIKTTKDKYPKP